MSMSRVFLPLLAILGGCETVEETGQGLDAQYNPCGSEVAPSDCPGGKPAPEGSALGQGLFSTVVGSEGTHWLEVTSLGCTIEMDSEGTPVETEICPDCSLVLQMRHVTAIDGCGVGGVTYEALIGLVPSPESAGAYTVFVSIYEGQWYAMGNAEVDDWTLRYEAGAVYDYAYDYYGGLPSYSFVGEHELTLGSMR
jgi:hypothetical protein